MSRSYTPGIYLYIIGKTVKIIVKLLKILVIIDFALTRLYNLFKFRALKYVYLVHILYIFWLINGKIKN